MSNTNYIIFSSLFVCATTVSGSAIAAVDVSPVLEEVTVTAKYVEVDSQSERTVYDLRNNIQAKTQSISDVLSSLPRINIAPNGGISVGGGSVAILIDGKPSPLLRGNGMSLSDALQTIPASSIAKIEVITNPGPEFRMSAATIINLITKESRSAKPKGEGTVGAGPSGRRSGSLSMSSGMDKWTFSGSASLRKDLRHDILDTELITKNSDGSIANREVEHRPTFVPYTAAAESIAASYALTSQDTLNLSGEAAQNDRPRRFVDSRTYLAADGTVTNNIITDDSAQQHFDLFSVVGDYTRKNLFGRDTLSLKWRHADYDTVRDVTDVEYSDAPAAAERIYRQRRVDRELIDTWSGDYVLTSNKDRELKMGFEVESTRYHSFRAASSDLLIANEPTDFQLDRSLLTTYTSYRLSQGKWTIKAGLRGESMMTRFAQDSTSSTSLDDLQWSPNLSASRELTTDSAIGFNYARRIDRPSNYQLTPLRTVVLSITDIGNPYLKPGETNSIDGGYRYTTKSIALSSIVYVRSLRNQIVSYYVLAPGGKSLVSSYENAGRGNAAGLEISATLRFSTKLGINLSTDVYRLQQTMLIAGVDVTHATYTHLSKLGLTWTPRAGNTFQVQGQLRGRTLLTEGTQSGYGSLNLSYGHDFTQRLKLVINGNDVLNTVQYHELINTETYRRESTFRVPGQVFYVGVTYKLGAAESGT